MQITPIHQYRTNIQPKNAQAMSDVNFQGLHVSKRTLKKLGTTKEKLLQNQSLKNCADRAELFVKSRSYKDNYRFPKEYFNANLVVSSVIGFAVFGTHALIGWLLYSLGVITSPGVVLGLSLGLGAACPAFAAVKDLIQYLSPDGYIAKFRASDGIAKGMPSGRVTKVREMQDTQLNKTHNYMLTDELMQVGDNDFRKVIYKYRDKNLSDTKTILDILNEDIIKKNFTNGDVFNYKLNKNGETLLTKFLDILPDENNQNEYKQIMEIMKRMPGIIYHQKDHYGISALERILNSENPYGLELVKDYEFPYSEEIDWAYNNIADEDFKNKAKSLKIDFKSGFYNLFDDMPQIDKNLSKILSSPFLDKKEYSKQIMEYADKNFSRSYNTETVYPILMKYGLLPPEKIDSRIQELESNLERNSIQNDSDYGYYS